MNNDLDVFHDILFLNNRPYRKRDKPQAVFKELRGSIKNEEYSQQPCYEISFPKTYSEKTRYYSELISNETIRYFNQICELVENALDDDVRRMWIETTLNKKIADKLSQVSDEIIRLNYSITNISPSRSNKNNDINPNEEAYIFQFLKLNLILLYLNIQESFKGYLNADYLEEEDIYLQYFNEAVPSPSYIMEAPQIKPKLNDGAIPRGTKPPEFKPIMDDIRDSAKDVSSYHYIVKNPERFAMLEDKLFANDYLNLDYSFTDKHGYKNELAIIYHLIIEKGYFKKFNDSSSKPFKVRDFVKFLDHRYKTNIDKQFRTYKDKIEERTEFIELRPWLVSLPSC
jgi:hypothetical protein